MSLPRSPLLAWCLLVSCLLVSCLLAACGPTNPLPPRSVRLGIPAARVVPPRRAEAEPAARGLLAGPWYEVSGAARRVSALLDGRLDGDLRLAGRSAQMDGSWARWELPAGMGGPLELGPERPPGAPGRYELPAGPMAPRAVAVQGRVLLSGEGGLEVLGVAGSDWPLLPGGAPDPERRRVLSVDRGTGWSATTGWVAARTSLGGAVSPWTVVRAGTGPGLPVPISGLEAGACADPRYPRTTPWGGIGCGSDPGLVALPDEAGGEPVRAELVTASSEGLAWTGRTVGVLDARGLTRWPLAGEVPAVAPAVGGGRVLLGLSERVEIAAPPQRARTQLPAAWIPRRDALAIGSAWAAWIEGPLADPRLVLHGARRRAVLARGRGLERPTVLGDWLAWVDGPGLRALPLGGGHEVRLDGSLGHGPLDALDDWLAVTELEPTGSALTLVHLPSGQAWTALTEPGALRIHGGFGGQLQVASDGAWSSVTAERRVLEDDGPAWAGDASERRGGGHGGAHSILAEGTRRASFWLRPGRWQLTAGGWSPGPVRVTVNGAIRSTPPIGAGLAPLGTIRCAAACAVVVEVPGGSDRVIDALFIERESS